MNLLRAISVASPPWCAALKFLNPSPFFGGRRAEALQKILHLEIFWGFRTRTAPAGGGAVPYRRRGVIGAAAGGRRRAVADPAGRRQRPGRAEGRQQGGEAEKEGGRGIDKASYSLLSLSPKPKSDPSGGGAKWPFCGVRRGGSSGRRQRCRRRQVGGAGGLVLLGGGAGGCAAAVRSGKSGRLWALCRWCRAGACAWSSWAAVCCWRGHLVRRWRC